MIKRYIYTYNLDNREDRKMSVYAENKKDADVIIKSYCTKKALPFVLPTWHLTNVDDNVWDEYKNADGNEVVNRQLQHILEMKVEV